MLRTTHASRQTEALHLVHIGALRLQPGLLRLRQVTFGPEIHHRNLHEVVNLAYHRGWRRVDGKKWAMGKKWGEDLLEIQLISTMLFGFFTVMLAPTASKKHPILILVMWTALFEFMPRCTRWIRSQNCWILGGRNWCNRLTLSNEH